MSTGGERRVAELLSIATPHRMATSVASMWSAWNQDRRPKISEWNETRNFLFATDTTKTANSDLPWTNKTTLPKLAQIRDNLHANYLQALMPNDNWLKWEAHSEEDADKAKRIAIQSYMSNKVRESGARTTLSRLLLDYIDYGNAFAEVEFVHEVVVDADGVETPGYIGPRIVRISPLDIVINPMAPTFNESPKIVRHVKTIGDLKAELALFPTKQEENTKILNQMEELRRRAGATSFLQEDFDKAFGYEVDGFGNLLDYYQSGMVEVLELTGDIHDVETGVFLENWRIVIVDRLHVVISEPIPAWKRGGHKVHVGWRNRPDNVWAMGPLDNLVGMQYRIDHLENLKADVFDLIAFPPLLLIGDVEDFEWGPREQIHLDDPDADVKMLVPDTTALNADTQIALLERRMEEYAGAPREAMGIRTPGEKTAFEVQELMNAAGRIFQEKITSFEINLLEPLMNNMLESAQRNMTLPDVVRVMDDDIGVEEFLSITKEDIIAKGKLRPVGARHFAAQAQMMQNLTGLANTKIWDQIQPHMSSKALAQMVEELLQLDKFDLVRENVGIEEQAELQGIVNQMSEDLEMAATTPVGVEEEVPVEEEPSEL